MRILFDQGTPVPLRTRLAGHTVSIAFEKGWSALENGELFPRPGRKREGRGLLERAEGIRESQIEESSR